MTDKLFPSSRKTNSALSQDDGDVINSDQSMMNRVSKDFFTSFDFLPLTVFEETGRFVPKTYLSHDPEKITVIAELPGVDAADIDIMIKPDMLIISGVEKEDGDGAAPHSISDKRRPTFFRKVIPISSLIDMQNVQAIFEQGILQIKLTKITQNSLIRFRIPIKKD